MAYNYHEQTLASYKNVSYGGNSIYNSGCGPASLCNALDALGLASVTVREMCAYSVSVGARVSGGTSMPVLLKAAAKKYGFTYEATSSNAKLLAHLNSGGVAIMNQGSAYKVFSNGGHFICAVAAHGDIITVIDSYWNDNKYRTWPANHAARTDQRGVVEASLTKCGKATADRSPSYYLITPNTATKNEAPKEDTEVIEATKFNIGGEDATLNAINKDGSTFVNLRDYNNALGLATGYDSVSGTRTVAPETIALDINGVPATVPGMNIAGTTYGAVRAAFKAAGYEVGWNGDSKTVTLKK